MMLRAVYLVLSPEFRFLVKHSHFGGENEPPYCCCCVCPDRCHAVINLWPVPRSDRQNSFRSRIRSYAARVSDVADQLPKVLQLTCIPVLTRFRPDETPTSSRFRVLISIEKKGKKSGPESLLLHDSTRRF
jgi:hypothetical protein